MTTYIKTSSYFIEMYDKTFNVVVYRVWEKFCNIPHYECYIDNVPTIRRNSRIAKRDVINYIERYL